MKLKYELLEINASKEVIRLSDIQQKTNMLITNNCTRQVKMINSADDKVKTDRVTEICGIAVI